MPQQLCPIALTSGPGGLALKVLNPGASRCRWKPGDDWLVGRDDALNNDVVLAPGSLQNSDWFSPRDRRRDRPVLWTVVEGLIDAKSRQSEQNGKDADGDRKGW